MEKKESTYDLTQRAIAFHSTKAKERNFLAPLCTLAIVFARNRRWVCNKVTHSSRCGTSASAVDISSHHEPNVSCVFGISIFQFENSLSLPPWTLDTKSPASKVSHFQLTCLCQLTLVTHELFYTCKRINNTETARGGEMFFTVVPLILLVRTFNRLELFSEKLTTECILHSTFIPPLAIHRRHYTCCVGDILKLIKGKKFQTDLWHSRGCERWRENR